MSVNGLRPGLRVRTGNYTPNLHIGSVATWRDQYLPRDSTVELAERFEVGSEAVWLCRLPFVGPGATCCVAAGVLADLVRDGREVKARLCGMCGRAPCECGV